MIHALNRLTLLFGAMMAFSIGGAATTQASDWPGMSLENVTISGKANFEMRYTLVPLEHCETEACPEPQPYWVLVVQGPREADVQKYELDRIFSFGIDAMPDSIIVDGVVIRPGSHLMIDAKVQTIATNYALIREINKLDLVMD